MDNLKSRVDMRDLVANYLQSKKTSAKNYDVYRCPFHNEQKGYSFVVYESHAQCLGKCGKSWDCFAFLMEREYIMFSEAKEIIQQRYGIGTVPSLRVNDPAPQNLAPMSEPPDDDWQSRARHIIEEAQADLWHPDNASKALKYLRRRGLTDEAIQHYRLGYVKGKHDEWRTLHGHNVPCGILIPHLQGDTVWRIKVRRATGNIRYQQVAGGNVKGFLFGAGDVVAGKPLIIDEGEFNAMILNQCDLGMCAVALGSTGNMAINQRWFVMLAGAPVIYARMDAGSGDKALAHLRQFSRAVKPLVVPDPHKDPNDYYLAEGSFAVWAWANRGEYEWRIS